MKRISMRLSTKSINRAIKELEDYRTSLESKNAEFVKRLLEEGIRVAERHTGRYTGYISFEKKVEGGKRCVGILTGKNSKQFISTWVLKDGTVRTAEVNSILMAEFGSGWLSNVIWNVSGVGQGTFPGQTHATDADGWWWKDEDGIKHHSIGEIPQYPMYNAEMAMLARIDEIAREVFSHV